MRVILIKYGELTTKKANRNFFIKKLTENLQHKLKNMNVKIVKDRSRMYLEFLDQDLEKIERIVKNTFGIYKYHLAYMVDTNKESIERELLSVAKNSKFHTFKVEVKRSDKKFPFTSLEYAPQLGSLILKNISNISVDVHHPDITFTVEIREGYSYIYTNSIVASGGYPVGTQERGMLMLSGGIDSPVAGYLSLKRGIQIEAVYFEAIPHTSIEAREKVIQLCKKLVNYTDHIHLHIVPFTAIQEEIYKKCREDYCITMMRRMMYRIMERLAMKHRGLVIINGESIGQVASQTLVSMNVINSVTNLPVIRPVACLDKLEIMDIAKKIDTYDTSILPYEDCCTVFVPKHPVIHPRMDVCLQMEEQFDYQKLIDECLEKVFTIKVTDFDENEFSDLL